MPGIRRRPALRLSRPTGRGTRTTACASTRRRSCSTRTAGRSRRPPATAGSRPGDPADARDRDEERRRRRRRTTTGRATGRSGAPWRETVIYEAHLAGFTADPSSGVAPGRRGTYAGFIDKIPYLVDLGITAVELLPVFAFDRLAAPAGLVNYWGYQPVVVLRARTPAYASGAGPTAAVDEFRDLVKALHRAGIEVILDVVYNHTAEVGADGPTFGFRGLANDDYYLLDEAGGYRRRQRLAATRSTPTARSSAG